MDQLSWLKVAEQRMEITLNSKALQESFREGSGLVAEPCVVDWLAAASLIFREPYRNTEFPQDFYNANPNVRVQLIHDAGDEEVGRYFGFLAQRERTPNSASGRLPEA